MAKKRSPKAGVPMQPFRLDEGVEIDICPITKGIWLDLGELSVLTGLQADLPYFREAVNDSHDTIWPSPVANCRLREMRFHPDHDVVIDYCPLSGGIWLDAGELDKLKHIARELKPPFSQAIGALRSIPTNLPPPMAGADLGQTASLGSRAPSAARPLPPRPRKK